MHRAKSIAGFRGFDPAEDKEFDKNPHLKALRDGHDAYEQKCTKSIDDFEEKCTKSVESDHGSADENIQSLTDSMDGNLRAHKKAVVKIAKGMCKAAFGEEDQPDEKTLEILKEFLTPHIDAMILPAVVGKIGTRRAAERRKKLGEAHELLKAASTVLGEL